MKAFILAIAAIIGISVAAAYALDQLPNSAGEARSSGNVRLN